MIKKPINPDRAPAFGALQVLVLSLSGCTADGNIFNDIEYVDGNDQQYIFSISQTGSWSTLDVYPENADCDLESIDLSGGNFSIVVKAEPCAIEFFQNQNKIGSCLVPDQMRDVKFGFGVYENDPGFGSPGEPITADELIVRCKKAAR